MGERNFTTMGICSSEDPNKNKAFLFIKPHAVNDKVKALVKDELAAKGLQIVCEGEIKSEDIDAEEMDKQWGIHKKADKLIKFGGGFYCGHITIEGKEPCYVFNGFFMQMRNKYVAPGLSVYYYVVEWDAASMSWEDFRSKALGPTDPNEAADGAIRKQILDQWQALGLPSEPNTGDNGMHGSASPFEALAELVNWTEEKIADEPFGKAMLDAGISEETIKAWSVDPQVDVPQEDGTVKKGSLFDAVEDTDAQECLDKLVEIHAINSKGSQDWSWKHFAVASAVVLAGAFAYKRFKGN